MKRRTTKRKTPHRTPKFRLSRSGTRDIGKLTKYTRPKGRQKYRLVYSEKRGKQRYGLFAFTTRGREGAQAHYVPILYRGRFNQKLARNVVDTYHKKVFGSP